MRFALSHKLKSRAKSGIRGGLLGALLGGLLGIFLSTGTGHAPDLPRWNGWSYAFFCARLVAIPAFIIGVLAGLVLHREKDA
jgi:MFS family permease